MKSLPFCQLAFIASIAVGPACGGTVRADDGKWKVPGEFQKPSEHWQVPGEIKQPKGPWRAPGEIAVPKEIRTVAIRDRSQCERVLSLGSDTLFEFDRSDLSTAGEAAVAALGKLIADHHPTSVAIGGHTDSKGSDEYNQSLSERRAATVASYLKAHQPGVPALSVAGFGEKQPIAPNEHPDGSDDPDGRAKNRRVEVTMRACEERP